MVVTSNAPRDETQRLLFTNVDSDTTSIRLYVSGTWTSTSLKPADANSVWESAIETALGCSGCVDVVGNAGYSSSNKTISFLGTGSVDLLAVDEESIVAADSSLDANASSRVPRAGARCSLTHPSQVTVERILSGSSELTGTFTLSYDGAETEAIDVDASAEDVKAYLEDLSTLSVVEVSRNTTSSWGAAEWLVTFLSEAGDLPLMRATSGRLSYDSATPAAYVETVLPGTSAVLVYNGSDAPDVLDFEATGLTTDSW